MKKTNTKNSASMISNKSENSKANLRRSPSRKIRLAFSNEEQSSPIIGKRKKNDFLSRKEICDLMLWSQAELTWYTNHDRLPLSGKKISRSVLREWESVNLSMRMAS